MLAAFLLCAWKDGLQTLLDTLFESLAGCPVRAATKSALSQARQKLKASAFVALNQRLLTSLEAFWPEPRWRGLRLVAADGTTLRLPDLPENRAEFGVQAGPDGQPLVMARALGLYSVGAGRLRGRRAGAPRRVAARPGGRRPPLVGRGFPATWLFALLLRRGRHFLARIDGAQWPEVQAFAASGLVEQVVTRPGGGVEILATSLLDAEACPAAGFAEVCHGRWGIEEAIKLVKHRLNIEQFSGELPGSVRQDFHAKLLTASLAWALAHSARETLPPAKAARYQPNLAYVLARLRLRLFVWLLNRASPDDVLAILTLAGKTLELKRPGRSAKRPKSRPNPKPRRQYK